MQTAGRQQGRKWPRCGLVLLLLAAGRLTAQEPTDQQLRQLIFEAVVIPAQSELPESAPPGASGSPAPEPQESPDTAANPLEGIADYQERILQTLDEEGLYSENLREDYQTLAALQQQVGQYESAVTTLENAMHIARVNEGLFTERQIPDVENIIANLQQLNDREREAEYRSYLHYIQLKNYSEGDPRLIAAQRAWASWNLAVYRLSAFTRPESIMMPSGGFTDDFIAVRNYRNGEVRFVPRRQLLGTASFADMNRFAVTADRLVDRRLREARDTYQELLDNGNLDAAERDALRYRIAESEYLLKRQLDAILGADNLNSVASFGAPMSHRDILVVNQGLRDSIEVLEAVIEDAEGPEALARARINLGDLYLAYNRNRSALEQYTAARTALDEAGEPQLFDALFAPAELIPVPVFTPPPYSRGFFGIDSDDRLEYRGYIDLSMEINRSGDARRIKVTGESPGTPYPVRRKLIDYLRGQPWRPRLEGDELAGREELNLRFYYSYGAAQPG